MATIEERAWEKYPEVIKHHNLAQIDINEEKRRMYIEISTEQKAIDDKELQLREEALFENVCDWISEHYEHYAAQSRGNAGVAATMTLVALREAREKGEITDKEE